MIRLAVARLWFCSNSFNPRRTRLADLRRHEWTEGQAALDLPRAPGAEINGLAAFLAVRPNWEVVMLRCAAAPPGGPLAAGVLGAWLAEVELAVRSGRFDALYLSLHGACQAEGDPAADVTVLRRLRMAARRLPIVATFDSRANISDEVPLLLDASSTVRAPGDGAAAARRALAMLEGILTGPARPIGALARVSALVPPAQLRRVMQLVWREQEEAPPAPLLDVGVFSGFPWADAAWAGPAALVWADRDSGAARDVASRLALRLARGRDAAMDPPLPAAETLVLAAARGPALVLDPADDPDSGGLGDTPELLRALLARADGPSAFAVLADPRALAAARDAGEGGEFEADLGAGVTVLYGPPVTARVHVGRLMADMAVLLAGPVAILVADRPIPVQPALLAAAGIVPEGLRVLALKGGEGAGAAFVQDFPLVLAAGCPGPCSRDLDRLPFAYVPMGRRLPGAAERFAAELERAGATLYRQDHRRPHGARPSPQSDDLPGGGTCAPA